MALSYRTFLRIGAVLLALAALVSWHPAQAADGRRCFAETGFCISGVIRSYWERGGGLGVFGYPITPQQTETIEGTWTGPVQWFERDRLEDHTNEGKGVLAGRLGDRYLQLQGSDWRQLPGDEAAIPGCRFFSETQFNLCEPFLSYWKRNGGLERFGYPISRARQDAVEGQEYTVQYFERRRMELHPENAGTPYNVLLGLLGKDIYTRQQSCAAWFFGPAPQQCPLAPVAYREGAAERFEHGFLLWTREPDSFFIFLDDGRYWIVSAPYSFPTAPAVDEAPPHGRYKPVSGFGELWRGALAGSGYTPPSEPLRTLLGWAVEPEHPYRSEYQCHGGASYAEQRCYLRGPSGDVIWFGPYGSGRWL